MEVDQIHCKFQRNSNGYGEFASAKLGEGEKMDDQHQDDEDEGENKRSTANDGGGGVDLGGGVGRLYGWPSSRIVRVSRASGGKDRHSKVLTSKGLRDRRVRLSVNTAIQFYDLQDRLGYDQPSKAVEWLLTAAASAIEELPPMNTTFLNTPRLSNERISSGAGGYQLAFDSAEVDMNGGGGNSGHLQHEAATKSSPGSSNSETSKGSGISISRSESRMRARERAKERAEQKEKENDSSYVTSFTELLSGRNNCINGGPDYFTSGLFGPPAKQPASLYSVAAEHQHHHHHQHPELQPFSFASDSLVSAVNSPGFSAINRGTLQSNSQSPPSLLPIFPPPPSFFSGPMDNHHHFLTGYDARFQHHYGRNSGQKEKEKN